MMHVVIDTSVYRTDPKRSRAGFHAITRLAVARQIRIHLPYYVRQEVLTQQAERLSKEFNKAIKSLESVKRITQKWSSLNFPVKSPYGSPRSVKLLIPPTCLAGEARCEAPRLS